MARMGNQALKPCQFVSEFRSGLRIAVWQVNAPNEDTTNRGFHIAGLVIMIGTGERGTGEDGGLAAGENCHAVP